MPNGSGRTGNFERSPASGVIFSPLAVTSVAVGAAALALAVLPWVGYAFFPLFGYIGTFGMVIGLPAAIVGLVTGSAAMRGIGAAAHRSRPMAKGGLVISLIALVLGVAWLVFFFTSLAGELERLEPDWPEGPEKRQVIVSDEGTAREYL